MPSAIPSAVSDPPRLAALDSYAILDTPAEPGFDGIVHLTSQLCAVPVALVSLVAGDRQWFKARVGFPPCETDLKSSVCAHALAHPDELLIIPDLTADPRTRDNPLVTGAPFIRFYAGAPLVTSEGHVLGSLCAIDPKPRPGGLSPAQAESLRVLAQQVVSQLELRRAILASDAARTQERVAFRAREALRDTQAAVADANGDPDAIMHAIVGGALRAVPAAEGATVETVDGDELEYRVVAGTLLPHRGLRVPRVGSLSGWCASTGQSARLADALTDPRVHHARARLLGQRATMVSPVTRVGQVLGVLKLQAREPDVFTAADLEQLVLFTGVAANGFLAAAARAELRAKDTYWRGLFNRLSEGFVIGEIVRDADGRGRDWRYVEVNPAWGTLLSTDPAHIVGRTIREVLPGIEDEWIDEFVKVVDTGEPHTFTRQVGSLRRWYDGRAFPLDGDRFGVIFLEVTDRVEAETRRAALLQLGDLLRDLTTVPEMTRAATEIVGRTLGVTRSGFGLVEGDIEQIVIEPDWTAPDIASIAGRHRFDDFGDIRAHLQRGEPLVVDDVTEDARTRQDVLAWRALQIGALVNMPVRERGRTVAVFVVHDINARAWMPEELTFLRNVADRLESGVARVRAEGVQTVLNHELAHRLKNTLAVVQSIARQTLRGVSEQVQVQVFERRILALSHAHDVLLQKSWSAARLRTVTESVLTMQADLDRFELDGPDLDISSEAALSLSMLLHELATNALKYGSLSVDGGGVGITWHAEPSESPTFVLRWRETGGPPATPPSGRMGFGSKLIRMGLLGTRKADLIYGPEGFRAEFRAPLANIQVQIH